MTSQLGQIALDHTHVLHGRNGRANERIQLEIRVNLSVVVLGVARVRASVVPVDLEANSCGRNGVALAGEQHIAAKPANDRAWLSERFTLDHNVFALDALLISGLDHPGRVHHH